MENITKTLIIVCICLVGTLGVTVGLILPNFLSNSTDINITPAVSQNNSSNSIVQEPKKK